jgi:membrane protein
VFSVLVLSPLTLTNAVTYGPVGTVLMVQSWLIGVGFVIFGGALLGRQIHHGTVPDGVLHPEAGPADAAPPVPDPRSPGLEGDRADVSGASGSPHEARSNGPGAV